MASDNLMKMEQPPWLFRQPFADAWISDIFTMETDSIAKALQHSFSPASSDGDTFSAEIVEPLFAKPEIAPIQTPTASGGSENEATVSKQRRSLPPSGRVAKRKPRPSKRVKTMFITADPANFRQMVQQVTGVRCVGLNGQLPVAPVLKPEPHRAVTRHQPGGELTTLDTSGFLLDGSVSSLPVQPHTLPPVLAHGGASAAVLDFNSFCSFPTLESSKLM